MKSYKLILLALICWGFAGSASAKHIWWLPETSEHTVRIYLDRKGDYYPVAGPRIERRDFLNKHGEHGPATLAGIFDKEVGNYLSILEHHGAANFEELQAKIIEDHRSEIAARLAATSSRQLVIFIHGFNDDAPEQAFAILRESMRDAAPDPNFVFVEVRWDGLLSRRPWNPLGIWPRAQPNSYRAGMRLRQVLKCVPEETDLYVVTHSLGASVGTQLLFDSRTWNSPELTKEMDTLSLTHPTPRQRRIALAMLAPAMPGQRAFANVDKVSPGGGTQGLSKVIIGYNRRDYATSKYAGRATGYRFGATSLGFSHREVNAVAQMLEAEGRIQVTPIRFTGRGWIHGVADYSVRSEFDEFIRAITLDSPCKEPSKGLPLASAN
jgi:hypothetical protein